MKFLQLFCTGLICALTLNISGNAVAQEREHYILQTYSAVKPDKSDAMDTYLSKVYLPASKRAGAGPVGVFRQQDPAGPASVHVLTVLKSAAEATGFEKKLAADNEYSKATRELLGNEPGGQPYERVETSIFAAIEGVPKLVKPDTAMPRLLNLRIYESPTPEAHAKKVEMFNTGELAIFKRSGLAPVFFGSALSGPRMPNLTYLLVFSDDEARKAAWKKFGGDPDWQTLKVKPGFTDKEIIRKITNILLTPAPYSEI